MLKNMNLGKKLIITFTLVAIIASLSGITSAFLIKSVDNVNNTALFVYAMPQGDIGKAMLALTQCQKAVCNIISFTDQNDINAQKEDYDKNWKNYTDVYSPAVRDGLATQEGKAIWSKIEAASKNWLEIKDRALKMGDTTDPAQTLAAQRILVDELVPAFGELYDEYASLMVQKVDMGNITADQATKQANIAITINIITIIVAMGIAVILGVIISRGISNPIKQCVARLNKLAEGDLQSEVPEISNRDETGQLAEATRTIVSTMSGIIQDVGTGLEGIAGGDLTVDSQAKELYVGDFKQLSISIDQIIQQLNETMLQINNGAEQVASGSQQVSDGAQVLSEGATEQASAVEELTATITEISNQVSVNAENAKQANTKAEKVGKEVEMSNERMRDMVSAMTEISKSSQEIENIIKTIEDIASQTNLLSLNASIEAARAGEVGRGFAVVANEVSELASKSAEASKNTSQLIQLSLKAVENGTKIAHETAETLEAVASGVNEVCSTIYKISEASNEQAYSISQVTSGVEQISSVVQSNSATAQESAAASEELFGRSDILKSLVNKFKLKRA